MDEVDEGWLERVFDKLDVAVISIEHATGRVLGANDAYARMFGLPSARDAIGRSVLELYADPKERKEIEARLLASESFRKTGIARMEVQRLRLDNRAPIDVLVGVFATFDADGRVVRMEATLEDIGERKRAEKAFRASEERFRAAFETSNVGMAITDLDGHLQRVNAAYCRFLGRDEKELLGVDARKFVHEDDRALRPPCEVRFVRKDGEIAWGYVTFSSLSEGDESPHSTFVVVQDISARKRGEQDLQRLAKLESLGVLAGGIAHDFNNILALILGNISFAAQLPDAGPRTRELLGRAEVGCKRAGELARRLLTFAKGGVPLKRSSSVAALVCEAADLHARDARVELDLPPDLWPAELDTSQMSQVMHNLLLNAREASAHGGVIRVSATNVEQVGNERAPLPAGRYVRVSVKDEGTGISQGDLERIFDPYFSTKKNGSGLGLTTAHSIVQKHGGHVCVTSTLGRGATFDVYLPACDGDETLPHAVPDVVEHVDLAHKRVLVMDDDESIAEIIATVLRDRGAVVDVVTKGEDAIAAFEAGHRYDVVLLDLTIPDGLGGATTLPRLRAIDPSVKAIVMSGYSADAATTSELAARLSKPFAATELAAIVHRTINSAR